MTDERLCAYGDWAGHPDRDAQAARIVRELVREVRRLRKELQASALDYLALEGQTWEQPAPVPKPLSDDEIGRVRESLMRRRGGRVVSMPTEQPVPMPFRGILHGITAADVYGVHV